MVNPKVWCLPFFEGVYHSLHVWYVWFILCFGLPFAFLLWQCLKLSQNYEIGGKAKWERSCYLKQVCASRWTFKFNATFMHSNYTSNDDDAYLPFWSSNNLHKGIRPTYEHLHKMML